MIPKNSKTVENNLSSNFESKKFGVTVSDKTFSVLFDTLYQDKITSLQRELYSNAMDSHIAAGCPEVPFSVQLPTPLEPTFKVRDYGTSLTHDEIMGMYSTVFETSKAQTNEQVGYLGLGSKSPYSYTDSFTVKAYMDGEVRTYLAAFDENRIPTITFLTKESTSEPTGLEVSFPVRKTDVEEFRIKAAKVCIPLPVMPKFNVGVKVEVPTPVLVLDSGKIKIYQRDNSYWARQNNIAQVEEISIKQGWVIYPVSRNEISTAEWLPRLKGVVIEVPIGTVDVAASRETLSLNEATKKVVNQLVKEAGETVAKHIEKKVASCANYYEACAKYFSELQGYIETNNTVTVKYDGKTLKQMIDIPEFQSGGKFRTPENLKWPELKKRYGQQRRQVNSAKLPTMTFYYKLDTEKVPRYLQRLNDHAEKNSVYLCDITQAELDSFRKDLSLEKKQFVSVDTLPDDNRPVKGQKTAAQGTTTKPYKADGKWTREVLPANGDYVWLPVTQKGGKVKLDVGIYSNKEMGSKEFHNEFLKMVYSFVQSVAGEGGPSKIPGLTMRQATWQDYTSWNYICENLYLLTSTVESKISPPKDKRLDIVIEKYVKDNVKHIDRLMFAQILGREAWTHHVTPEMFGEKSPNNKKRYPSWETEQILTVLNIKNRKVQEDKVKVIKTKYPLLFNTDSIQIKQYIDLINKVEKEKTHV